MCAGESGSFNLIKTVQNPTGFHVAYKQVINGVSVIGSETAIYIDSLNIPNLVWKLNILPQDDGDWYILVNTINSNIILKENIAIAETGNGTVWDPDAATYLEDITLPDNNDEDYPALQPAYTNVQLLGLIPENDIYYLRGEYASSYDIGPG